MSSSYGKIFKITTFGESHGKATGVIIDGCPSGLKIDASLIQKELDRRKPGQSSITSHRKEADEVQILSGIFDGTTLGTPISLLIRNNDAKSNDYAHIADKFRPSHADYVYHEKYGIRDYRGGGRSSARETVARVAAGAIAKQILSLPGIEIKAFVSQVGAIKLKKDYRKLELSQIENNIVRCPDNKKALMMIEFIEKTRKQGDTTGGIITCIAQNVPAGLGEPVFDKLHAELAKAMLSINAVKGFEYGSGFKGVSMYGSAHNDLFYTKNGKVKTKTNFSGGIQGGISNGQDIYFRVAFKPVATIMKNQETIDEKGNKVIIEGKGRHDPCVVPRAVPIVEAMTAIVLADFYLRNKISKLEI